MEYQNISFGTYRLTNDTLERSLISALETGYRGIDTASLYNNQNTIGLTLSKNEINRNELWITSKLPPKVISKTESEIIENITKTLTDLNTNYIDLFLLHCPVKDNNIKAWSIIESFYNQGYIKNIGVSNYDVNHIEEITNFSTTPIFTNQIELSPFLTRTKIVDYLKSKNIKITAHSSLAKGEKLNDLVLQILSNKYSKTPAQIMLRWGQQNGYYLIPRSSNSEHIIDDFNIDFNISDEDMTILNSMNINYTTHPQYKYVN